MIGSTISHYRILERLGGGGMGIIYRAQDLKLDRAVALKFLPPELTRDPEAEQRFIQEARAASSLQHHNICTIHDIDETPDGQRFIVMDLYEGETLKKKLGRGPLAVEEASDIALQVARGLSRAHEHGIIHRDIKPANVIVTADHLAKILDFGLAKLTGGAMLTAIGSTVGTAAYMSPEQARGEEVDHRADIWSLGVVFYEMLTGRLPFRGEHESALVYSILNEECDPVRRVRPEVPQEVAAVVDRMLMKDPGLRYATMADVVAELSAVQVPGGTLPRPRQFFKQVKRPVVFLPLILLVIVLAAFLFWWAGRNAEISWARGKALDEISTLGKDERWSSAYRLVRKVEGIIPDDPVFLRLKEWCVRKVSIATNPPGAHILWREYADSTNAWLAMGETPASDLVFPRGSGVLRFERAGFEPVLMLVSDMEPPHIRMSLDSSGTIPHGMIHVPGGKYGLSIPGLEQIDSASVSDYYVDRYEVTNREYKQFVDAGGYTDRRFWKEPLRRKGRELSWEEALSVFQDQTGRPGPATWEVGSYPEGKAEYPVCGISWYEAAAYAEFAGKSLPTVFHWNVAAGTEFGSDIVPLSNFSGKGTAPVGSYRGISKFGAFDMAGNVREWCRNETDGQRYILGGGWNDQPYAFIDAYAQDPFDRSATNGFRCIRYGGTDGERALLEAPINVPVRRLMAEKPVSEETFHYYRSLFTYDKIPLASAIEMSDSSGPEWNVEKVSYKAAYGGERAAGYLFLPRHGKKPFQVVVFFPGSEALFMRLANPAWMTKDFDFILRDGRAVFYPVYKSTFERADGMKTDVPTSTSLYRDHVIMWVKDFSRAIDYLETRKDIDCAELAYFGVSWGGAMGGIIPAVESRIKVVVLNVAGLSLQRSFPEVDALNYVTRIRQPVLMLNGQYDHFFPVQTSMMPMYNLLGTRQKEYYLYPTGHAVPRTQLIAKTLAWLDRFLGPSH